VSDWGSESITAGFPRAGMTYYIQFTQEPRIVSKDGKYGTWTELALDLQFFAIDEGGLGKLLLTDHAKHFHYMSSCSVMVKPCAVEELTDFGPDIVTRLIEVKGFQHGKHVDLELVNSWDRISASRTLNQPATPPPAAVVKQSPIDGLHEADEAMATAAKPCSHARAKLEYDETTGKVVGYECLECGERVG